MNADYIKSIVNRYNSTGRIAFYHPRKHTISLNGGRDEPERIAVGKMLECIHLDRTSPLRGLSPEDQADYMRKCEFWNGGTGA